MIALNPARADDIDDLVAFLSAVDLTLSGLGSPGVFVWIARDAVRGKIYASAGFELDESGTHVLIRSVAVGSNHRASGIGLEIARFALDRAAELGAARAWLFSSRSGPFWQKLGFEPADRDDLAAALGATSQVQQFRRTGQLQREVAWSRALRATGTQ